LTERLSRGGSGIRVRGVSGSARAFLAALLFGFANALQVKMQIIAPVLPFIGAPIPHNLLQITPYVLTIIVVAGVVGRSRPPAAGGKPYEKQ